MKLAILIITILFSVFHSLNAQPATKSDIQELKDQNKDLKNEILLIRKDMENLRKDVSNEISLIRKDIEGLKSYVQVEVKRLDGRIDIITWALALIILLFGIPQFYTWSISMRKEKPRVKSITEEVKSMSDQELSELKKALKIQ
jgi:hypothetical protein